MFITTYYYFHKKYPVERGLNPIQKGAWISDFFLVLISLAVLNSKRAKEMWYVDRKWKFLGESLAFTLFFLNVIHMFLHTRRKALYYHSLKALMPPRLENCGTYFQWNNHVASNHGEDFRNQFFYKAFKARYADDPFCQSFFAEVDKNYKDMGYQTAFEDLKMEIPNHDALLYHADRYFKKYGIVIRLEQEESLATLLQDLTHKIKTPLYLGVITFQEDLKKYETAHVTPLLFYFSGAQKIEEIQALTLDSVGSTRLGGTLIEAGLLPENVFTSTARTQGDHFSCHTGALVLLRNALLSVRYHDYRDGFKEVLREGEVVGNIVTSLPPEWDYTEQVTNRCLREYHLAIRTCFSKKRKKPIRALVYRKKYTQIATIRCKIWRNKTPPPAFSTSPPEGVFYKKDKRWWQLKYTVCRPINTKLIEISQKLSWKGG